MKELTNILCMVLKGTHKLATRSASSLISPSPTITFLCSFFVPPPLPPRTLLLPPPAAGAPPHPPQTISPLFHKLILPLQRLAKPILCSLSPGLSRDPIASHFPLPPQIHAQLRFHHPPSLHPSPSMVDKNSDMRVDVLAEDVMIRTVFDPG